MNIKIFFVRTLCSMLLVGSTLADSSGTISERYISLALQGDLSQAESLFTRTDSGSESILIIELSQQFQARFIERTEAFSPQTGDAFVDAVVSAYRQYWSRMLMDNRSYQEGEALLEASLQRALTGPGNLEFTANFDGVFEHVGELLIQKGFHYLDVPGPPLRDLFLWKSEENKTYTVRLTDRTQKARVTFMKNIYSMGWKQFASLGLVSTTGWVEGGRLYCVAWAYDRSSENFEVSYLKHESRHLADFELFPDLQSTELEYRAKLTELAFASTSTRKLLDDFTSKSAPNPASPHAYANYRVTRDIYRELFGKPFTESGHQWQEVSSKSAGAAARNLLRQNTEMLQAAGP